MNNEIKIPHSVIKAFPQLKNATFIRRMAAAVPIVSDTTFDIFGMDAKQLVTLVTTDYVDPMSQSRELENISGQHRFAFVSLIRPYSTDITDIIIREHDDMTGDFVFEDGSLRYYLAIISSKTDEVAKPETA